MKVLADRILATRIEAESKTETGIIIPDPLIKPQNRAKIVAVGTRVERVREGDVVVFKGAGTDIELDGKQYVLFREEAVLYIY